ncbi:MAG: thiamine pyrophosphate-requiring protein [Steroidobacteraceae bacterium]
MYTTSSAMLSALREAGVQYLFVNLGSDHSAFMEAYAIARASKQAGGFPYPDVITCPNEMVALSAAHGHAAVSGRAQAVLVHVECGTQALAGAVHNAAKGRVPVLIMAGMSPATQEGEARGSRNEFIHWIQDVFDQRGLVRGYMRYDNEIRVGANAPQIVHRALQVASSDPKGPVYLVAAREILEQEVTPHREDVRLWPRLGAGALAPEDALEVARMLLEARRPLAVTTYLGRVPAAVAELTRLCRRLGMGVLESVPSTVNFAPDDPLHQGCQWNEKRQNPALAEADTILVLDSDVPWIPLINRPAAAARILHIDVDPLKQQMPLWYLRATRAWRADAATALRQINAALDTLHIDAAAVRERAAHLAQRHAALRAELAKLEQPGEVLTAEYVTAQVREAIGPDALVMSEAVTNFHVVTNHSGRTKPGTYFVSGGGSLGWNGGAAIGAKLARPEALVCAFTGDGTYMFSIPSTVHWIARRYRTPFLQIVFNNQGWRAPKFSMLGVHPEGFGSRAEELDIRFEPPPDYSGIAAAAGGAHAEIVKKPEEVAPALQRALQALRAGRCAVVDAWLPRL